MQTDRQLSIKTVDSTHLELEKKKLTLMAQCQLVCWFTLVLS